MDNHRSVWFAALWMLGTLASFSLMAVAGRELSNVMSTTQILFVRSAIGVVVVLLTLSVNSNFSLLKTKRIGLHLGRNAFHFVGQYGWFAGLGLIPLAQVVAIEFTVPIWTALLAAILLKERLTLAKVIAIVFGLIGVLIIVKPTTSSLDFGTLLVFMAAWGYAFAYVGTKALATTEHPISIVFYMCAIQLPIGAVFSLGDWVPPQGIQWVWLTIAGVTALSAHYCITQAMKITDAATVVTMDFLRLPTIAIVGGIFYGESLEISLLIGAVIMVVGNLIGLRKTGRTNNRNRTETIKKV